MGRKHKAFPPLALAAAGALLLTGGWLMGQFPLLIFLGLAPLFALAKPADKADSVFEKMELVLLVLAIALMTRALLIHTSLVIAIVMAIGFTLACVLHAWTQQILGSRAGPLTLIFSWLGIEYLALKFIPGEGTYLADALGLMDNWTRWTIHTGYLGISLWVLMVNYCFYLAFLQDQSLRSGWLASGVLLLIGPVAYSYSLSSPPITREIMINLYGNVSPEGDVVYLARGEWVVRTAAWISTLIILFTIVRHQTRKK